MIKKIKALISIPKITGYYGVILADRLHLLRPNIFTIRTRQNYCISFRSQTRDVHEIISLFSGNHYPPQVIRSLLNNQVNPTIVNVGAHIGLFDIYLKEIFPNCNMYSLEPQPDNYLLLKHNLDQNQLDSISLKMGMYSYTGSAKFTNNQDFNANTISESGEETIKVISLHDLMKEYKLKQIDLLKLDCEGSEFAILRSNLSRINAILLEYHLNQTGHIFQSLKKNLKEKGFMLKYHQIDTPLQGIAAFKKTLSCKI